MDAPDNVPPNIPNPMVPPPPTPSQLENLEKLVNKYKSAIDDIGSYVFDLKVEAQNNLLSGLFDNKVPVRKALDPKMIVISTEPDKAKHLLDYFEHETPWGKEKSKTEKDVLEACNGTSKP